MRKDQGHLEGLKFFQLRDSRKRAKAAKSHRMPRELQAGFLHCGPLGSSPRLPITVHHATPLTPLSTAEHARTARPECSLSNHLTIPSSYANTRKRMWGRSIAERGPTFFFLTPPRRRGAPGGKIDCAVNFSSNRFNQSIGG
jgi:hypothetical protein